MANDIHEDYPPANPAEWARADEERRKSGAGGFGNSAGTGRKARRRRGGGGRTYVAIVVLLVILIGGTAAAYLNGWIDIPGLAGLKAIGGGGSGATAGLDKSKTTVIFSGNAKELASPNGNLVQPDKSDPSIAWIRSSLREASTAGATEGVSVEIKSPFANNIVGKRVELTISARAPDQGSPSPFAVAFTTEDIATSGWVVFTPTKEFEDYTFDYQVPATVGVAQHVGIWSDISGRGVPLAIRSITVTVLN